MTPTYRCVTVYPVEPTDGSGAAQVLGELALAAASATEPRGFAAAVGELLAQRTGLVGLELVLPATDDGARWTSFAWQPGAEVVEAPVVAPDPDPGSLPAPKVRRAQGLWIVTVAVPIDLAKAGVLTLALGGQLVPPFALEADLIVAVARIVGMAAHGCELIAKAETLSRRLAEIEPARPLVAVSGAMRELVAQCELVAAHPVSVLLRGESGTGKEVLARHIHRCSDRAEAAFVAVNCAALPEALIESELFGHERGAFTGATQRHTGRFERASGGTLFLDEVAELPLAVQAKLLRVLQEGCFERVGGRETVTVDVRVIAASHRPLEEMLEQGAFRADLYYRLAVFPIVIPPLRERPEDIPALVSNKLQQMCARMGREVPVVPRATLRALCAAPWPGNVRELESYLERATILSAGSELVLPTSLAPSQPKRGALGVTPTAKLDQAIKAAVERALSAARGKIYGKDGAAAALGLKPSTLQAKMMRLGIDHRVFR